MAINDVSLTSGMRSNLLSLQNTVTLLNRTQNRLATGKKVNSAIDNPTSYFASQALTSRASQIDSLKDAMGQAVQTITAANKGITAITSLIEQAKGVAQSALSAPAGTAPATLSTVGSTAFHAGTASLDVTNMKTWTAGTVGVNVGAMSALTAGTVTIDEAGMTSFSAGTVNVTVGTLTAHAYGSMDLDYSAMTSHAYASGTIDEQSMNTFVRSDFTFTFSNSDGDGLIIAGTSLTQGAAADFTNQATLITAINAITGYHASSVSATDVHVYTDDNVVAGGTPITDGGSGTGVSNINVVAAGTLGDTVTIDGTKFIKGNASTNGFTDANDLKTKIQAIAGTYSVTGADNAMVVANSAANIVASGTNAHVTQGTETAGDTVTVGATTLTKGLGFTSVATMVTAITTANALLSGSVNGNVVTFSQTGANTSATEVTSSTGATAHAEVAGDTISWGAYVLTAGTNFTNATTLSAAILTTDATLSSAVNGANITLSNADGTTLTSTPFTVTANLNVGTANAEVAGDTITIGATTYTKGIGFTDAATLNTILTTAGYSVTGADSATVVSKNETTVDLTNISGSNNHVTQQNEVVGSTVTIDGTTYMKGRATNGFDDAAGLINTLTTAGYTVTTDGTDANLLTAAKNGVTVDLRNISGSDGVTANAEIQADTVKFGTTTLTAGTDFTNAATLAAKLVAGGYATSSATGSVVTASKDEVTVEKSDFTTSAGITVAMKDAEVAGTTFTIAGATYTAGIDFKVGATAEDTATNLATFAATLTSQGVASATANGTSVTVTYDNQSTQLISLQAQYSTILDQISALATDSGYKGKNLLGSSDLAVKFESATLTVAGFDASKTGLGLTQAKEWTNGGDINADITKLDTALDTLSQKTSEMSGNLSVITVRQDFSTNMENTLIAGSDLLTQADANEEGANMLMLQTRQSLSTSALSMSAQAAQSVLRLFQ